MRTIDKEALAEILSMRKHVLSDRFDTLKSGIVGSAELSEMGRINGAMAELVILVEALAERMNDE